MTRGHGVRYVPTTAQQPLNVARQQIATVYLWKPKATGLAMILSCCHCLSSEHLLFFAKSLDDGDIKPRFLHPRPYSQGVGMDPKPHKPGSLLLE